MIKGVKRNQMISAGSADRKSMIRDGGNGLYLMKNSKKIWGAQ